MRILLDMDGPLAGFDQHCWEHITSMGLECDIDGPHAQTARYFTDHLPKSDRRRLRALIDAEGWFRALPVVEGAQEGVETLQAAGHEVWVCTKPLEVNPTCRDEKGAWLREHFPEMEDRLIIAPDKSLIHGDVLLDDAPKLEWIGEATWHPAIFTAPYNVAGSEWAHLPHWTWGDDLEVLEQIGRGGRP